LVVCWDVVVVYWLFVGGVEDDLGLVWVSLYGLDVVVMFCMG